MVIFSEIPAILNLVIKSGIALMKRGLSGDSMTKKQIYNHQPSQDTNQ
jgi:hypothetical protein